MPERVSRINPARPQDAPLTIWAADGTTVLHGFKVEAVIYAPNLEIAARRLAEDLYLDVARIVGPVADAK